MILNEQNIANLIDQDELRKFIKDSDAPATKIIDRNALTNLLREVADQVESVCDANAAALASWDGVNSFARRVIGHRTVNIDGELSAFTNYMKFLVDDEELQGRYAAYVAANRILEGGDENGS